MFKKVQVQKMRACEETDVILTGWYHFPELGRWTDGETYLESDVLWMILIEIFPETTFALQGNQLVITEVKTEQDG